MNIHTQAHNQNSRNMTNMMNRVTPGAPDPTLTKEKKYNERQLGVFLQVSPSSIHAYKHFAFGQYLRTNSNTGNCKSGQSPAPIHPAASPLQVSSCKKLMPLLPICAEGESFPLALDCWGFLSPPSVCGRMMFSPWAADLDRAPTWMHLYKPINTLGACGIRAN